MVANPAAPVKPRSPSPAPALTIGDHTAPVTAWQRAYERARSEGVRVWHLPASHGGQPEEWLTSSVSQPGKRHVVTCHQANGRCDCEGAEQGLICKHLAAVVSARIRAGELVRCEVCGVVADVDRMHHELRWLGGYGWQDAWYCGEGYGHQAQPAGRESQHDDRSA